MVPFEDYNFVKVDTGREERTGHPEVIFGAGKTVGQVIKIFSRLVEVHNRALVTRASEEMGEQIINCYPAAQYDPVARLIWYGKPNVPLKGRVVVLTGGSSDIPLAEEAAKTAEWMGCRIVRIYDVGVAGIDRLLAYRQTIYEANVVIAVAGMEGALPSVVGGMVRRPVIAVPTSIGYGANFEGVTTLMAMMTSCTAGIVVVNIDNGFGAGFHAPMILQMKLCC